MNREMIAHAKKTYPEAAFHCAKNVFQAADYTLISGTYNLKMMATREVWWKWVQKSLRCCWEHSTIGMAFNMREDTVADQHHDFFYANAQQLVAFCQEKLGGNVRIEREGEMGDIHVYVLR